MTRPSTITIADGLVWSLVDPSDDSDQWRSTDSEGALDGWASWDQIPKPVTVLFEGVSE